jgi:hypothetical protein
MKKKIVALFIIIIASVVVLLLNPLPFRTVVQITSVDEIMLNPSAWVNKKVLVEGKLNGPLFFIPEDMPPWNYELSSNGTIGVRWNGNDIYNYVNVRVYGVVRQGTRGGIWFPPQICYYIEAKIIDML